MSKRGGLRAIYYWLAEDEQILLLLAYTKVKRHSLDPAQVEELQALVKDLRHG